MSTSTDTKQLVDSLVADASPIRRLRSPGVRLALWLGVQLLAAVYVFNGGVRPDIDHQLASPGYLIELAILSSAILLLARSAMGAAVPGGERWRFALLALFATVIAFAFSVGHGAKTAQEIEAFVGMGFPCAVRTTMLSLLPTAWLIVAVYRGAALRPARAGLISGAAGFLFGFTMMRVLCPMDEALHMTAWHWMPVFLGSAVSAIAGAFLFSSWKR